MENLSKVRFHTNKKPHKQTISLKDYFHRLYYKTKIRKTCEIEFYNYSKYKKEDPFYTLLKVNENGILLSNNIKNKLKELERYQYPICVVERLRQKFPFNKMNEYEIDECIIEFKKYIALVIMNRFSSSTNQNDKVIIVAMTNNIIDELWHTLILFSKEYHEFSTKIFGMYLHHSPNTKNSSISNDSVIKFYEGYRKYFGMLHPIWYYNVKEEELKEKEIIIDRKESNSSSSCNNVEEEENNYNNNINYKDFKIYQVLSLSDNIKKVNKYNNISNYDIVVDKSSILNNIGNFGSICSSYCHNCDSSCGGGCGGGCGGCG